MIHITCDNCDRTLRTDEPYFRIQNKIHSGRVFLTSETICCQDCFERLSEQQDIPDVEALYLLTVTGNEQSLVKKLLKKAGKGKKKLGKKKRKAIDGLKEKLST